MQLVLETVFPLVAYGERTLGNHEIARRSQSKKSKRRRRKYTSNVHSHKAAPNQSALVHDADRGGVRDTMSACSLGLSATSQQ
jgi:hypothetical protein